jgi:hypothetical protein
VTTTGITWRHFNTVGIPLGTKTEIVERFTPTADGSRLDYSITVTDPEIFTKANVAEALDLAAECPGQAVRMLQD